MADVNGLAVIDKQPGWTSHDVVAKARGILGTKKVGHSGTLDPDATGHYDARPFQRDDTWHVAVSYQPATPDSAH